MIKENNWTCEFCTTLNLIDADARPSTQQSAYVDYMLTAPLPSAPVEPLVGSLAADTVVYVIDLSGSMGVTTKVPSLQGDLLRAR